MYDRGYTRSLLLLGGLGVAMGHILLGSCTTYWQALLAQGILVGLGGGCLYVPALATLPSYFDVRLGLATGIAAAGNSIGGIIYPIMFTQLLPRLGFPWSAQILGFTALATLFIAALMLRCRSQSNSQRAIIDWTAFSDIEFMSFSAASLLGFVGLYVTFYYLPLFAQNSISVEPSLALYIVAITNAGSIIGRIIPTWVSDQTGPLNILTPCKYFFQVSAWDRADKTRCLDLRDRRVHDWNCRIHCRNYRDILNVWNCVRGLHRVTTSRVCQTHSRSDYGWDKNRHGLCDIKLGYACRGSRSGRLAGGWCSV